MTRRVGSIDRRHDAPLEIVGYADPSGSRRGNWSRLAHSYEDEVAPRPLPESRLLPMSLMDRIAGVAFFIGAAVIVAFMVWTLLTIWLVRA